MHLLSFNKQTSKHFIDYDSRKCIEKRRPAEGGSLIDDTYKWYEEMVPLYSCFPFLASLLPCFLVPCSLFLVPCLHYRICLWNLLKKNWLRLMVPYRHIFRHNTTRSFLQTILIQQSSNSWAGRYIFELQPGGTDTLGHTVAWDRRCWYSDQAPR